MSRARLCAALAALASERRCETYGVLAARIGLEGPGRIAHLTTMLEELMEEDAHAGRPLRAALVVGRASGGLPAHGFFLKALELGFKVSDPAMFHRMQLNLLFS